MRTLRDRTVKGSVINLMSAWNRLDPACHSKAGA